MNIHEYQAKKLLQSYNIPTSTGIIALNKEEIDNMISHFYAETYVVKAQIHAGGRGKAGGVKILQSKKEARDAAHEMYGKKLITHQTSSSGQTVKRILIESSCNIISEYYFSMVVDRANSSITIMASTEGGVEIEEVAKHMPEKIIKISIDPTMGIQEFHCRSLAFRLGFRGTQFKQMVNITKNIYTAFVSTDSSQIEINPLVLTEEGELLALDAKMNFDENALFRNPNIAILRDEDEEDPLEVKASKSDLSYIRMDGNIGCMVNGAGLAMATMDIIKLHGAKPANFLDVGGGADKDKVTEAFKIILSDKSVKGILVNIFGGIMRCDIIAKGIAAAATDIELNIPLVVRLEGTNSKLGKEILANSELKIITADDLGDAANKIVTAVKKSNL